MGNNSAVISIISDIDDAKITPFEPEYAENHQENITEKPSNEKISKDRWDDTKRKIMQGIATLMVAGGVGLGAQTASNMGYSIQRPSEAQANIPTKNIQVMSIGPQVAYGEPDVQINNSNSLVPDQELKSVGSLPEFIGDNDVQTQSIISSIQKSFNEFPAENGPFNLDELSPLQAKFALTLAWLIRSEALPDIFEGQNPTQAMELVLDMVINDMLDIVNSYSGEFNKNVTVSHNIDELLIKLLPNELHNNPNLFRYTGLRGYTTGNIDQLLLSLLNSGNYINKTDQMLTMQQLQNALPFVIDGMKRIDAYSKGDLKTPFSTNFIPMFISDPSQDSVSVDVIAMQNPAVNGYVDYVKKGNDAELQIFRVWGHSDSDSGKNPIMGFVQTGP